MKTAVKCEIRALDRIRLRVPNGGEISPFVHCTGRDYQGALVINVDLLTWYAQTLGIPSLICGDEFNVDLWEDCLLAFIVDPCSPRESWRQIYRQIRTLLSGGVMWLPVLGRFDQQKAFRLVWGNIKLHRGRRQSGYCGGSVSWL
ncbi:hypothetical protein MX319_001537 [Salmonella enterica]|nr:hypothetical protein [Salmonella enterica]EJC1098249.1 hypothetical protein [Salmonella enterica]EJC1113278.1 hypothetical protein [Salmonella enterica]EKP1721671.1 hypothetical protein [Salmonella enterica]EKP1726498.1 hypothetical protein [Salmonella enterica]